MLIIDYDLKCIAGDKNDIFKNISSFKYFHCKYDVENKVWLLPDKENDNKNYKQIIEYVKRWNVDAEKTKDDKKQLWREALDNLGFKYVQKGTDEYNLVLEEYKKLLNMNNI